MEECQAAHATYASLTCYCVTRVCNTFSLVYDIFDVVLAYNLNSSQTQKSERHVNKMTVIPIKNGCSDLPWKNRKRIGEIAIFSP